MPYTDHPTTPQTIAIGRWIASRRAAALVSQRQLARACHMSQSMISRLENGQTPGMSMAKLARVLQVLGWPPAEAWLASADRAAMR